MPTSSDHIDFLMARDSEARSGDELQLAAVLQMRDYLRTHGLEVKKFFAAVPTTEGHAWYWSPATWEARMSNATKVLTTFEDPKSKGWVSAICAVHAWNDDRVEHGMRETFKLQTIYGLLTNKGKAGKPAATVTEPVTEPTTPEAPAGKTQLDVVLAAIAHLTADELVTAAAAIAQRQTLVIAA